MAQEWSWPFPDIFWAWGTGLSHSFLPGPAGAQSTILTFEPPLLGSFFGTTAHSQRVYYLWYWLEPLATSTRWLGSYGGPEDP